VLLCVAIVVKRGIFFVVVVIIDSLTVNLSMLSLHVSRLLLPLVKPKLHFKLFKIVLLFFVFFFLVICLICSALYCAYYVV
jgi:hypothetical protein